MPENLRGNNLSKTNSRHNPILEKHSVHKGGKSINTEENIVNSDNETDIVHIGRNSQNECAIITSIGNTDQKALWDSGAGRCVNPMNVTIDCIPNTKLNYSQAKLELEQPMAHLYPTKANVT